jgi:hypothetical protein
MLTRGQVAKRLGVSIAAVRAFEGTRLYPTMRAGGWLFDEDEVDDLVNQRARGGGRLSTPFTERDVSAHDNDDPDEETLDAHDEREMQLASYQRRVTEAEQRESDAKNDLAASRAKVTEQAARIEALENGKLVSLLSELADEFDTLSPRQQRKVIQECPELLELVDL